MRHIGLVVVACAVVNLAHADDQGWQEIGSGKAKFGGTVTMAVDMSRIKRRQGLLTAWRKDTYSQPQVNESVKPRAAYTYSLLMFAVKCEDEQLAFVSATQYGEDSAPVGSLTVPVAAYDWYPAVPEPWMRLF